MDIEIFGCKAFKNKYFYDILQYIRSIPRVPNWYPVVSLIRRERACWHTETIRKPLDRSFATHVQDWILTFHWMLSIFWYLLGGYQKPCFSQGVNGRAQTILISLWCPNTCLYRVARSATCLSRWQTLSQHFCFCVALEYVWSWLAVPR